MTNGKRDFRRLTGLLEQPLAGLGDRAPAKPVWHCTVRAAPGDPELGDGAWMRIAGEIMHRTGLSRYGEEGQGVRWVAVHHGENHIHIAATLARQDGRCASLRNDYYRIGEALRDIEKEYGLQVVVRADRTAAYRPTRAEQAKAARAAGSSHPGSRCSGRWPRLRPGPGPSRNSSPTWKSGACGSGCGTARITRAR